MQDKQPTEKERAQGKFREKSSIEANIEKIADEAHTKMEIEDTKKSEIKGNPFLGLTPIIKE